MGELPWVDPIAPAAHQAAEALLQQLGALNGAGALTPLGRRLSALPLHPRLGRMLVEAARLGVLGPACEVAAALDEDLEPPRGPSPHAAPTHGAESDLGLLRRLVRGAPHAQRVAQTLRRAVGASAAENTRDKAQAPRASAGDVEDALARAALAGFGDRVGRRLPPLGPRPGELPVAMARGGPGVLAAGSQARTHAFVVALRADVRVAAPHAQTRAPGPARPHIRWAVDVPAEVLLDAAGPWVQAEEERSFDAARGRVLCRERLTYDGLTLVEEVRPEADPARALPTLAEAFWRTPGAQPAFVATLAALTARLRLAAELLPALQLGDAADIEAAVRAAVDAALAAWAQGGASLNALEPEALWPAAREALPPNYGRALREAVPESVSLPHGKRLHVTYGDGAPPFVESYLQDFFGAAEGPALAQGRLPLVVHLWGPNRRALQVTRDLASFWREHYPKLRPALARRYPKHVWPLDPANARPPPPRQRPNRR